MFCIFQAAIQTERLKALEWMERHNREKENLRDLQVFLKSIPNIRILCHRLGTKMCEFWFLYSFKSFSMSYPHEAWKYQIKSSLLVQKWPILFCLVTLESFCNSIFRIETKTINACRALLKSIVYHLAHKWYIKRHQNEFMRWILVLYCKEIRIILYDSERNSYHCETLDEDNLYVVIRLFTALENISCSLLLLYGDIQYSSNKWSAI